MKPILSARYPMNNGIVKAERLNARTVTAEADAVRPGNRLQLIITRAMVLAPCKKPPAKTRKTISSFRAGPSVKVADMQAAERMPETA